MSLQAPKIKTAIPQRRYRFGEYQGVVLGEIESDDAARYHYILALVREGESRPGFFITAEKNPRRQAQDGSHRLRVITYGMDEAVGDSDAWADLDAFCAEAFNVAARILGLPGERPVPLD